MDAATLHCPSCGAAAPVDATACPFCRAKLATVACPSCFGLIFLGSRFCAHCGAKAIAPSTREGPPRKCPRGCGEMQLVAFRDTQLDECPTCNGLWLELEVFERLCANRTSQAPVLDPAIGSKATPSRTPEKVRYVPCPQCQKIMNRVNFAKSSGIIIDRCQNHGVWFDADELRLVVEFVRTGGLDIARRKEIRTLEEERYLAYYRKGLDSAVTRAHSDRVFDEDAMNNKSLLSFLFDLHRHED
jgi:Zn-finger nucleic acid-binding protein